MDKVKQGHENLEWGQEAEQLAADYLYSKGYVICERNWRCGNSIEIDIIARKDTVVAFVEVKARKGDNQQPLEAVNRKKRTQMVRGADIYMERFPFPYEYRFDIITVTGTREDYTMEHLEDAFIPGVNGEIR